MKSITKYRLVTSSPSQSAKQGKLDSFKNEIEKEVEKKGNLLCKGHTLQYSNFCASVKNLVTYLTFDLLSNNFTIQTVQTKFKESTQTLTSNVEFGKIYYKDLAKGLEEYVKFPNRDLSAIYSKVEDNQATLNDVKSTIYYFYHYLAKMLNLQKENKKTELEDSKKNTQIFQRKVTNEQASSDEKKVSLLKKENDYTSVTKGFSSYGDSEKDSCYDSENELKEGCGEEISSVDTFALKKSINSADNFVQQELNQLRNDNAQLNSDVDSMWQYTKILESDNKRKGDLIQGQEKEREELKREIKELQEKEAQLVGKNKKLEEERSNWQTQQLSLANEVDKVVEPIKGSEEIDGLKKKIDKLKEENSCLKDNVNQLNDLLQKIKQEKRGLETKLDNYVDISNKVTQPTEENSQLKSKNGELGSQIQELSIQNTVLKDQVTKLTEEKNQLGEESDKIKVQLEKLQKGLNEKTSEVTTLTEERSQLKRSLNSTQQDLGEKTNALKSTQVRLTENENEINRLGDEVAQVTKEKKQLEDKLSSLWQELSKKNKEFNNKNKELADAKQKQEELDNINKKLKEEKTSEVNTLTEKLENVQIQLRETEQGLDGKTYEISQLTKKLKITLDTLKDKEEELKSTLAKITTLQQELDKKISEDKNKKPSAVEFQSRKQSNCASASFVLSGAFAVGASLTMFHLAICITLAVAALTFLAVGCYCSHKANTALSNVEVKNGVDPAVKV